MKNIVVIGILFMMLAVQYSSCGDFLFADFDKDSFGTRNYKLEARMDKNGYIGFDVNYLNGIGDITLQSASTFNKLSWNLAGGNNKLLSPYVPEAKSKSYAFNYPDALRTSSSDSPCQRIGETNDALSIFRLAIINFERQVSSRSWMPIYLRVKNFDDKVNRTIHLYGGSYKASNGHISNYDAYMTDVLAAQLNFTMENVTTANEPQRRLVMNGASERTKEMISQIKPSYIYFQCPKFTKLVPFTKDEILRESTTIDLVHLGIPFDKNLTCSFSLFFTDTHNEMNLIQIKGSGLFKVLQDPRSREWEKEMDERATLKRENAKLLAERDEMREEYNKLVIKYNDLLKIMQDGLDAHQIRPTLRSLVARSARGLVSKVFGQ